MTPIHSIPIALSGRDYDFNPVPYLKKLQTRMLLIYGTSNRLIPAGKCIKIARDIDHPNINLKIYDGTDHRIRIRRKSEILLKPVFPDGYLESLVDFIKQ